FGTAPRSTTIGRTIACAETARSRRPPSSDTSTTTPGPIPPASRSWTFLARTPPSLSRFRVTDAAAVAAALEPLFGPADIPNRHRVKAKVSGAPAEVIKGRRPTSIAIAQNLRQEVDDWRAADYAGASDTSRELL